VWGFCREEAKPDGKYVLLSVGMPNTTQEFCGGDGAQHCDAWTFMGLVASDPEANHTTLVIVNGAAGGQASETWVSPTSGRGKVGAALHAFFKVSSGGRSSL
jgi:hypothetical protein